MQSTQVNNPSLNTPLNPNSQEMPAAAEPTGCAGRGGYRVLRLGLNPKTLNINLKLKHKSIKKLSTLKLRLMKPSTIKLNAQAKAL